MRNKKALVDFSQLKPGMITADEIGYNGTILVGKNIILTEQMIEKLKLIYNLDNVEIYNNVKESKEMLALAEAENTLKNVSESINVLFSNSQNLKADITNEINNYSKHLLDYLKIDTNIFKNIILKGSGEDCIYRHSVNVASLSYLLGKWIGMEENKLHSLVYASILHDFGKTKINKKIINKKTPLTEEEFDIIKEHTIVTYNEIKEIPFISQSVLYAILMHHERCDGSGYPLKLKGNQIHEFAKIIAITDTFDAINSNRIYKKRKKPLEALKIIKEESLTKLDYSLCNTFLRGLESYYIGQTALLSDNSICKIIKLDLNTIDSPLVFCNDEFIDLAKTPNLSVIKLL